jgi:hypothetical protein
MPQSVDGRQSRHSVAKAGPPAASEAIAASPSPADGLRLRLRELAKVHRATKVVLVRDDGHRFHVDGPAFLESFVHGPPHHNRKPDRKRLTITSYGRAVSQRPALHRTQPHQRRTTAYDIGGRSPPGAERSVALRWRAEPSVWVSVARPSVGCR